MILTQIFKNRVQPRPSAQKTERRFFSTFYGKRPHYASFNGYLNTRVNYIIHIRRITSFLKRDEMVTIII